MQASKYEDKSHQKIFTIYEIFINRMCIDKVRNFDLKKKRKSQKITEFLRPIDAKCLIKNFHSFLIFKCIC